VGAEICRALDYAHRRANIVHRDVTPRNVLIDDEGAVRLIDFGIAAPVTRADDKTRTEVFGSPGHMPPEQLHGADLTPATDVFAVGVLLIEAWTGYPPFRRATAQESERALFVTPLPIDRQTPELTPLAALIARSIALDARERPSAAEHLARPLREFLKSEDSGDIARRLGARVQRSRRRARSSSPWLPGETGSSQKAAITRPLSSATPPSRPASTPTGAPVTRTFAARDDLEIWTRKLSTSPPPETPAATPQSRRLAESRVAARVAEEKDDAAREPPPITSSRVASLPKSGTGPVLAVASAVAFVALAFAFGAHRTRAVLSATHPQPAELVASGQPLPTLSAEPPPLSSAASAPAPLRPRAPPSKPQKNADIPAIASVRAETSADAEPSGVLRITADPRAAIEVSGANFHALRQTPVLGLKVPSGTYQLVFRNETFGTPIQAQVTVVAGATRSVHADFRQAEPTIAVR
jgi:hypothetical protein